MLRPELFNPYVSVLRHLACYVNDRPCAGLCQCHFRTILGFLITILWNSTPLFSVRSTVRNFEGRKFLSRRLHLSSALVASAARSWGARRLLPTWLPASARHLA